MIADTAASISDCVVCHRWLDDVEPGSLPGICAECEAGNCRDWRATIHELGLLHQTAVNDGSEGG